MIEVLEPFKLSVSRCFCDVVPSFLIFVWRGPEKFCYHRYCIRGTIFE